MNTTTILVKSKNEEQAVLNAFRKLGIKWFNGDLATDFSEFNENGYCICYEKKYGCLFQSSEIYFRRIGYKIISTEKFLIKQL